MTFRITDIQRHVNRILVASSCLLLAPSLGYCEGKSFAGWYRTRLAKLATSDCDLVPIPDSQLVLFLQIRENKDEVAGDFCPSFGILKGKKSKDGKHAVIEGFTDYGMHGEPLSISPSPCDDKKFRETLHVELLPPLDSNAVFSVRYTVTRSCRSKEFKGKSCTDRYKGIGFFETHKVWPIVNSNFDELVSACKTAQQSCVTCHSEYKDLPLQ